MARKSAVGLDIGTHGVHVAEVTVSRGQPTLTNFGGVALPPGAVREGEVIDVDTVAGAVRQLWADARVKDKLVNIGVSNQRVVVRQIDLPFMEDAELRGALRFQVQEYVPMPVEEAELDYQRLEEYAGEGNARMLRILLVAAHRDMVANAVAAATRAGLRPVGVDLNAFAALRALVPDPESAPSEMVVDIGSGVTNIVVHDRGVPRFVRILVLGGGDVTDALATGMNITYEDAEALKVQTGLRPGADPNVNRIIEERATQFVDEVRGSLDYYLAQTGAQRVARVLLSGGGAKLAGLAERLGTALRIPVEFGRPLQVLPVKGTVYGPEQLAEVEPVLATAVGLALGGLE